MRKVCLPLFLFLIALLPVSGQKYLIIEKAGNPRTERIAMYEHLTFQQKDDDSGWYTRQILDLEPNGQLVLLGEYWLSVDDITRIKLKRQRLWPNLAGVALASGGATMILGDIWYSLRGHPEFTEGGIEFGFLNIGVGLAMKSIFGPIKYRLGDRKRLRIIDITY